MSNPIRVAACAGLFAATMGAAWAGEHRATQVPPLPQYRQECGACHVAYPPGLLPATSWQRLMNGLGRHFGTDASLEAATTQEIGRWLVANAGTSRRGRDEPPQDRITRSTWFVHEHDEVATAVWQRPAIRTAANCTACHTQADQGDFNEHRVRIPR